MNAPSRQDTRLRPAQHDCCDGDKHPAVLVWPTAMTLSWIVVGLIGWVVVALVT